MQPDKPDFESLANELFKAHADVDVFYFTSDRNAFQIEHEAYNHSLKLKDRTITEIYRPDISDAEIKDRKAQQQRELQQGAEIVYRNAFPELARAIDYNKTINRK